MTFVRSVIDRLPSTATAALSRVWARLSALLAPALASLRSWARDVAARTAPVARSVAGRVPPVATTVRARILLVTVLLTAIALAASGTVAFVLQERSAIARVDADLAASTEEFRLLAESGTDPDTLEPFASAEELLRAAMEREVPGPNEGMVGVIDGEIALASAVAPVALEDDAHLNSLIAVLPQQERSEILSVASDHGTYRLAIVPVATDAESGSAFTGLLLAYDLDAELGQFSEVFRTYALVAAVLLAIVSAAGWLLAGRLLRPVHLLATRASTIGREDLSERIPVSGADDLATMTRAVNGMLDRLETSFTAQHNLMNDVSHELKTPLTVIAGHLDVMDPGNRADVAETRALVVDEVHRMGRVVDDLGTLALASEPSFVVREGVDIGALTDAILDRAVALGPRRWVVDQRAHSTIMGDRQRLLQAWLQLAANAVKYSDDGSTVRLGSGSADGEARLWVADEGIGIAEADIARIFERFGRADGNGAPGAGLGLPIVDAIAQAHGGYISVESALGVGSVFTIHLPRRRASRRAAQ